MALVRGLVDQLPASTTSQLALLRGLEVAVVGRRIEIEPCLVPVLVPERPAIGETHLRDAPQAPPLPQSAQTRRVARGGTASAAARHRDTRCWRGAWHRRREIQGWAGTHRTNFPTSAVLLRLMACFI